MGFSLQSVWGPIWTSLRFYWDAIGTFCFGILERRPTRIRLESHVDVDPIGFLLDRAATDGGRNAPKLVDFEERSQVVAETNDGMTWDD